jgi:hypothetical protein
LEPYFTFNEKLKSIDVVFEAGEFQTQKINEKIDFFKCTSSSKLIGCRIYIAGEFIKITPDDFK